MKAKKKYEKSWNKIRIVIRLITKNSDECDQNIYEIQI